MSNVSFTIPCCKTKLTGLWVNWLSKHDVLLHDQVDLLRGSKADIRLPGKGNSNSHGARPVHQNHLDDCVSCKEEFGCVV